VARAADATHASAAALALLRGKLMVCRAATGLHAPDLGVPLDTRDGLSGACARLRTPQVSDDTESDPRVDPAISRRLGIRSMLVVPVFAHKKTATDRNPPLTGVLEVFSPLPNSFTQQAQVLLADFADECARIHNVANQLQSRPRGEIVQPRDDLILSDTGAATDVRETIVTGTIVGKTRAPDTTDTAQLTQHVSTENTATENRPTENGATENERIKNVRKVQQVTAGLLTEAETEIALLPLDEELLPGVSEPEVLPSSELTLDMGRRLSIAPPRQPYEIWTLILGALVILAAAAFSFMIGSRIGWLRSQPSSSAPPSAQASVPSQPFPSGPTPSSPTSKSSPHEGISDRTSGSPQKDPAKSKPRENSPSPADELVVYNNGKVVFRMKPAVTAGHSTSAAGYSTHSSSAPPNSIWLAPTEAESRLITRIEPQYPADALAAHRSGNVTLEVQVAEDGTVSSVNALTGDPLLAEAAAQAVRNWRYQPYRANDHPSQFQTDVTLTFSLPN
jgi:protein TonB